MNTTFKNKLIRWLAVHVLVTQKSFNFKYLANHTWDDSNHVAPINTWRVVSENLYDNYLGRFRELGQRTALSWGKKNEKIKFSPPNRTETTPIDTRQCAEECSQFVRFGIVSPHTAVSLQCLKTLIEVKLITFSPKICWRQIQAPWTTTPAIRYHLSAEVHGPHKHKYHKPFGSNCNWPQGWAIPFLWLPPTIKPQTYLMTT